MTNLIQTAGILTDATASSREEAVALCGSLLLQLGAVAEPYLDAMWERELIFSSYVGREVAMPHGTDASRKYVTKTQVVMVRLHQPIDWDGEEVKLCFGIAATGDQHGGILANLAEILMDDEKYAALLNEPSKEKIIELLNTESE
jgi:mannitol/fructose-specific phosphotransferase system IIA component